MIKSINYQANQIASIEISDPADIETLGDSYGYGSTARVTGQISAEYMYTPNGWINTSDTEPSPSGGVTVVPVVHGGMDEPTVIQMKASELLANCENGVVFIKEVKEAGTASRAFCEVVSYASFYDDAYSFTAGTKTYTSDSADGYPASGGGK